MLGKLPSGVGRALRDIRPGLDRLTYHAAELSETVGQLRIVSPAFDDGHALDPRFTADGAAQSPPLSWSGMPVGAQSLALIIEDADSPTPHPLVHAIVWNLPPIDGGLAEGELASDHPSQALGRNSYFKTGYLAPDPPPGHGPHRYAFQLFASSEPLKFNSPPGRGALIEALAGTVLAKACLVGTYERS